MTKYYRVKKNTFMWEEGAILKLNYGSGSDGGYMAISDLWDASEYVDDEYISKKIIEDKSNSEWFERVYSINLLKSTVYKIKEEAIEIVAKIGR